MKGIKERDEAAVLDERNRRGGGNMERGRARPPGGGPSRIAVEVFREDVVARLEDRREALTELGEAVGCAVLLRQARVYERPAHDDVVAVGLDLDVTGARQPEPLCQHLRGRGHDVVRFRERPHAVVQFEQEPVALDGACDHGLGLTGEDAVVEIAHHPEAAVWQGDALDLPVVPRIGRRCRGGRDVGLTGDEGVTEAFDRVGGNGLAPPSVQDLPEIAPKDGFNLAEHVTGALVHRAHAKVRVDDVDAEDGVLQKAQEGLFAPLNRAGPSANSRAFGAWRWSRPLPHESLLSVVRCGRHPTAMERCIIPR